MPNGPLAEINSLKAADKPIARAARGRWFFVGMAMVFIATIAGFLPAIVQPQQDAPLTLLVEAHGIAFFMWLFLYLFLLAPVAFDYLTEKRVRFLPTAMAIGLFASQALQAFMIGPSTAWHRLAEWMSR